MQAERADEVAPIMHRALKIASDPPAGPVFVALPIDVMEQETDVERLGAAVRCEGIRMHQVLPSGHPNFRLALPFDAVAIRKALDGADTVLLVGGPFFEEVWYAPGSPGCRRMPA